MSRPTRADARCRARGCHRPADYLVVLGTRAGRWYAAEVRCNRHAPPDRDTTYAIRLWQGDGVLTSKAARACWLEHLREKRDLNRWYYVRHFLWQVDRKVAGREAEAKWRRAIEARRVARDARAAQLREGRLARLTARAALVASGRAGLQAVAARPPRLT